MNQKQQKGFDEKSILTMIALATIYPLGLILMWKWTKWNKWVKILIMIPLALLVLAIAGIIAVSILVTADPKKELRISNCNKRCEEKYAEIANKKEECFNYCKNTTPTSDINF